MIQVGFPYLKLGLLNQDCVENHFGRIRSFSHRFVRLNCIQTERILKAVLINSVTLHHSNGSNCLNDLGKNLCALKTLIDAEE